MFKRGKEYLLNCGSRYEGVIWFILVALSILPLITTINLPGMVVPERLTGALQVSLFFATTSIVSGRLSSTLKRRSEQDE